MLYQIYETQRSLMEPFADFAQAASKLYSNSLSPLGHNPFAQRVSADFHLKPLSRSEVAQYIDWRLHAVGARSPLFSPEACALVAQASSGIPRTINILCDTALVYGFATQAEYITKEIVSDVIEQKRTFGIFAQRPTTQEPQESRHEAPRAVSIQPGMSGKRTAER